MAEWSNPLVNPLRHFVLHLFYFFSFAGYGICQYLELSDCWLSSLAGFFSTISNSVLCLLRFGEIQFVII